MSVGADSDESQRFRENSKNKFKINESNKLNF